MSLVQKTDRAVFQQLTLNKLWIPDVLIDLIKDYLYYNKDHATHRHFQRLVNGFVSTIASGVEAHSIDYEYRWVTSCIGYTNNMGIFIILAQPTFCIDCGNLCCHHGNLSGICLHENEDDTMVAHYINDIYPFEEFEEGV